MQYGSEFTAQVVGPNHAETTARVIAVVWSRETRYVKRICRSVMGNFPGKQRISGSGLLRQQPVAETVRRGCSTRSTLPRRPRSRVQRCRGERTHLFRGGG